MEQQNNKTGNEGRGASTLMRGLAPRKIKFRAWDEDNEEMLYPEYDGCLTVESGTRFAIGGTGKLMSVYIEEPVITKPKLLQYTGLEDKNGNEIYEGDILMLDLPDYPEYKKEDNFFLVGQNNFYNDVCYLENAIINWDESSCEVIGNVFQNPELIP